MPRLVGYKLGIIRNDKAKEALFGTYFRGMGMNEFRRAGERFADSIDRRLRPDTMTKLNWHLSMGHDVYIVTASMPQWIRPWATAYGISDVIGTEPETDSGETESGKRGVSVQEFLPAVSLRPTATDRKKYVASYRPNRTAAVTAL